MELAIIGTGYVGLVAGTCFAESGNDVVCVDIDEHRIQKLRNGQIPFYEPGLEELTKRNIKNGRLQFTTEVDEAIKKSKVIFVAVGTPSQEDGSADLSYLLPVIETIARVINEPKIIVIKSTVPVGSARKIEHLLKTQSHHPFVLVSNPEFLKEGSAVTDFLKPERVVIGTTDTKTQEIMKELYEPFVRSGNPILCMDNTSAELSKYACNAFLAMKISFINDVANFCERVSADVDEIRKVMMTDSRIGQKFLYPGTGYGGSCFAKDVRGLIKTAETFDQPLALLKQVETVNERQKLILYYKLLSHFNGNLEDKTVAIWGLSFKPNTDDIREAPAIAVIEKLISHGTQIQVYDPVALSNTKQRFQDRLRYFNESYHCLAHADALLIFTEWNEFRKPNFQKIKSLLKSPVIFDGRNLYSPLEMSTHGFIYKGIGRL